MISPKDGDEVAGRIAARSKDRAEQVNFGWRGVEAQAPEAPSFVTRNTEAGNAKGLTDAFTRGFAKALQPYSMFDLRIDGHAQADATYYRLGTVGVRVSGLELMQATDVEALGHAKGEYLKHQYMATMEAIGDALTGGVGIVRMERVDPEEVPQAPALSFDAWYASPYARVYERHAAAMQAALERTDDALSRVLHELAGQASLCWTPKPTGEFAASQACEAVEDALRALRAALRV